MRKIYNRLCIILAAVMVFLSACGGKVPLKEPVTARPCLSVTVFEPLAQDVFSQKTEVYAAISRETGVDFTVAYDESAPIQKLSLLEAAGELPDIFVTRSEYLHAIRISGMNLAFPLRDISEELYLREKGRTGDFLVYNGELYAVTGGVMNGAREGVFINSYFLGVMKTKLPENKPDLTSLMRNFASGGYRDASSPVILGIRGDGLSTAERLFSIWPLHDDGGRFMHRIFSGEMLNFLNFLYNMPADRSSLACDASDVSRAMEQATAFIGDKQTADRYNMLHPGREYLECGSMRDVPGSLAAGYGFGEYMTFVSKTANFEKAAVFLEFLTSDIGNTLTAYGIQNRHYIETENGPSPVGWVRDVQKNDMLEFMRSSGVGAIPYFSGGFPGASAGFTDIWPLQLKATPFPTDTEWEIFQKIEDRLFEIYSGVLLKTKTPPEGFAEITALRQSEEMKKANQYILSKQFG